MQEFSSEAVIWRQLNHPNILPLYGVNGEKFCFASPWMDNGDIVQFLKLAPETDRLPLVPVSRAQDARHSATPLPLGVGCCSRAPLSPFVETQHYSRGLKRRGLRVSVVELTDKDEGQHPYNTIP